MDYETEDTLVRIKDGIAIARLRNPNVASLTDIQRLTASLNEIVDRGTHRLVIDFKHVRYVGSTTLGMLIALQQKIARLNGKLVLTHIENIAELLRVSKTDKLFTLCPDSKTALQQITAP